MVQTQFIGHTSSLRRIGEKAKKLAGFACQFLWVIVKGYDRVGFFLPAAGNYNGTTLNNRGSNGNYWSRSIYSNAANGYNLNFNSSAVNPQDGNARFFGFTVRAVQ